MTEPEKGSAKSFRYNSALEHNIGKYSLETIAFI